MNIVKPRLFLCSGIQISEKDGRRKDRHTIELDSLGDKPNVHIQLEKIANRFNQTFSPRLIDLLEIASYVFSADSSTERGEGFTDKGSTEKWGRDFHFVVPVRDLNFWQSPQIIDLLIKIVDFTSNDKANFDFVKLEKERITTEYLDFGGFEDWELFGIERVTMFSGGLDSLAGVVQDCKAGKSLMLVSHSPVGSTLSRQTELYDKLKGKFSNPLEHVPVVINKKKNLGNEFLQRTRSFLFSAIGTIIAETIKADGVRFYENGIVSLNLPVADEVLRARASRTTHPQTLKLYSEFYSLITEREFIVDNPFIFKTKADVIEVIKENQAHDLIQHSCSCAHTGYFQSSSQWHCGTCSQCIDRRVAILASSAEEFDPITDYKENVFTGKRKEGYEKNMAVGFTRHALELRKMSEFEIESKFSLQLARASRYFPQKSKAKLEFVKMHKKHAESVFKVLSSQIAENSDKLLAGELDKTCMLSLVSGGEHLEAYWIGFANNIFDLLEKGIGLACETHLPKDEPHLQQICDGILQAHENLLTREFPFMRWSTGYTKADWSANEVKNLQIEAKYVRAKNDLSKIRKDIAEDITKYSDNGQRVLFFIYDPHRYITKEEEFSEPVTRRDTMIIRFLRN
jgi:7-cyano-7-deazaguanine synthase in queuosine biosynthesis